MVVSETAIQVQNRVTKGKNEAASMNCPWKKLSVSFQETVLFTKRLRAATAFFPNHDSTSFGKKRASHLS